MALKEHKDLKNKVADVGNEKGTYDRKGALALHEQQKGERRQKEIWEGQGIVQFGWHMEKMKICEIKLKE